MTSYVNEEYVKRPFYHCENVVIMNHKHQRRCGRYHYHLYINIIDTTDTVIIPSALLSPSQSSTITTQLYSYYDQLSYQAHYSELRTVLGEYLKQTWKPVSEKWPDIKSKVSTITITNQPSNQNDRIFINCALLQR
jgi:hypothetical protein